MKHLDLFSGIGGFALAARWAGFETIGFCEIEPYCQKLLKQHWPDVPIYNDVRKLDGKQVGAVDIITGGFPCQDLSSVGQRKGIIDGERSGLWGQLHRLIGELRPKYAIIENVTGLLTGEDGAWFTKLLSDLAAVGYDAEWHCIRASAIGLPHSRDRVWIIAHPCEIRWEQSIFKATTPFKGNLGEQQQPKCDYQGIVSWINWERENEGSIFGKPMLSRDDDGFSEGMDRVAGLGNAIVPQIAYLIMETIKQYEALNIKPQTNGDTK